MPWAKNTYERTEKVYKELLKDVTLANKTNIDLIVKEILVRSEILKHDFTKRQLSILMFIITFSFMYGKEYAVIPKLKDFRLTGISEKHIKNEIDKLVAMNVVCWNKEEGLFKICEPITWKDVPYNSGYNDDRSRELFFLNLDHAGIDVSPIIQRLKELGL